MEIAIGFGKVTLLPNGLMTKPSTCDLGSMIIWARLSKSVTTLFASSLPFHLYISSISVNTPKNFSCLLFSSRRNCTCV